MTEEQFFEKCQTFSERMNAITASRDDTLASLERELEFVSLTLEFLIAERDSAPAHMQAAVTAEIEHLGNVVGMMTQALFARKSADAEAMLLASSCGQITIQ